MSETSDEHFVARVVATGDTAAFEALVRRHHGRVRNWLRQLARDPARADDLAQETFIRAWRSIGSYSGKGTFASWIMRIAYTSFLQEERKRRQDQRLAGAVRAQTADAPPSIGRRADWTDASRMLAVLSEEERLTMVLSYAHEMSHSEIAEVIGMPIGTVKSHLSRAKMKIRRHFALPEHA